MSRRAVCTQAAIALLLGALAVGCSSPAEQRSERVALAEAYIEEGRTREALIELRGALKLDPKSADINLRIAKLLRSQQNVADAAFFYGEAYRLDPTLSEAALSLAMLLSFAETDRAEALVEGVLERAPNTPRAYVVRSHLALIRNDADGALAAALTATELAPDSFEAWNQLGLVHQGRILKAGRGQGQVPAGTYEEAIGAFERASGLGNDSQLAQALRERARVLATWPGHQEEAESAFRELVVRTGQSEILKIRRDGALAAMVYARRTDNQELLRWAIERLLQVDPENTEAWTELALLEQVAGGDGEAVLRQLVDQAPEASESHLALAHFLVRVAREEEAIAHLESVEDQVDDPPEILGFLVDLHFQLGRREEARALIARLEADYPEAMRTELARAQAMISEGRTELAAEQLRQLTGRFESAQAEQLLATAELRRGRVVAAREAVDKALALSPSPNQQLLRLNAKIHYAARNWRQLLEALQFTYEMYGRLPTRLRVMYAEALFETNRPRMARSAIQNEIVRDDRSVDAVLAFARYRRQQEPKRVRALLEDAAERWPNDLRVLTLLAQSDLDAGEREQALRRLDGALSVELPPQRAAVLRILRAQVLLEVGQIEKAESDAVLAFQAVPGDPRTIRLLVAIYTEQGRLDEAIASMKEAQEVGALGTAGLGLLARLYAQTGRNEEALALLEQVIAEGGGPRLKNDLAWLLAEQGQDLNRALTLATEAKADLGDDPSVSDTLGYVYYRRQLYAPAMEQFRHAIDVSESGGREPGPESAVYHYHLALALRGLDRREDAIAALTTALARNPDLSEAQEALAELQGAGAGAAQPGSS